MHRVVVAAGILAVWLTGPGPASVWAQDCDPLKPAGTIDKEVRNAAEANANILLRSLGQGSVRDDYQRIEQSQQFSNPDDANRWGSFIYMLCTLLKSSSLSDNDKLVQYFKLVELSRQSPPSIANTPTTEPLWTTVDRFHAIDLILETLELGNIAFNAPRSINLNDTAVIQLMLGLATPIDQLKRMIEAEGEKEGARIRVSDRMEARLSGFNFAITAINPETQVVSRSYDTEWKWEIKPNSAGRQYLHLTISALIFVDDTSMPRLIRTFDRVIEVEVAWYQRVGLFVEKNWQWLWAALLAPVVGWLWKKKKEAKSSIKKSDNFSYVDLDVRIPAGHPLLVVRVIVDAALARLTDDFEAIYAPIGRPSIPPEQLLRALLLQAFYTVPSERQLMEQLGYNLLFRWFVGLGIDDPVWDVSVFTKNRDRFLASEIAGKFFAAVLDHTRIKGLLSDAHFSVDVTLIQAWASLKSFHPNKSSDAPPTPGRNGERDSKGEERLSETHQSTTDDDASQG